MLLFRAGRAGLIRVNANQMIDFYNSSVSTDGNIKTIKMDLLIDWENKLVDVFVAGSWKGNTKFFQEVNKVDQLKMYNLYQSTSYWKNIAVCNGVCYSFKN
jgi:hypothetical protein